MRTEAYMLRLAGIAAALTAVSVLCGCAVNAVSYNGKVYNSQQEAREAQKKEFDACVDGIAPTPSPVGGKVLVALPSKALCERKGIQVSGNALMLPPAAFDYLVSVRKAGYDFMLDSLRRRKIFGEVSVAESDYPERVPTDDGECLLYPAIWGPYAEQWFLRRPGEKRPVPLYMDRTLGNCLERTLSWLDCLEGAAAGRQPFGGEHVER